MFFDTHCHINMIVKDSFDTLLSENNYALARTIIDDAQTHNVTTIINVGTSLIESENCVRLAQLPGCYAVIGIHPNDCTQNWRDDLKKMRAMWCNSREQLHELRIVGIGETGLDYHYLDYDKQRQYDAFKAHIELALEYDLALIVHTRDAHDETLHILDEYRHENIRGIIHCFSENQSFAEHAIQLGFVVGIGGTITYPKNNDLRSIVKKIPLEKIVLETDAPFLPIQSMRGQKNYPRYIPIIAQYLADLRNESLEHIATTIAATTKQVFAL